MSRRHTINEKVAGSQGRRNMLPLSAVYCLLSTILWEAR